MTEVDDFLRPYGPFRQKLLNIYYDPAIESL